MKAIILNAGKGSRLAPFTDDNHKSLIDIGGKKIIDFQVQALQQSGIKDIVIVVGYLKEKIQDYLQRYTDLNFTYIENAEYASTNTAYSLRLAKKEMEDDFIYLNGDVLFHPELIQRLVKNENKNVLAVEKKQCGEEEVKVILNKKRITSIGKKIPIAKCFGEFIGVAKFSKEIANKFKKALDQTIEKEKLYKEYFEHALELMIKNVTLTAVDISDLKTIEIDFPEDLERAKKIFETSESAENSKKKILFYVERDLHLPFLEPIHNYLKNNYKYELAFSAPEYIGPEDGKVGIGLQKKEIERLKQTGSFVKNPEDFKPDVTVVSDVSFSLKNCGKIVNVGHGIISKGGFYRDAPIVRRENLADLTCVPGAWHKQILEKNVFTPIVVTGFIKSDKMFGENATKKPDFCKYYKIDENKKIILYAPTFNKELSSIPVIGTGIADLIDENKVLLIKLHSMTDKKYAELYKNLSKKNKNIIFIEDLDLTPSLIAADVLISDVSSAAVEFLFLDKPVIVYNNPDIENYPFYAPDDIEYKAREACKVVNNFDELKSALEESLNNPAELSSKRQYYTNLLCYGRDGKAAQRAAEAIDALITGKIWENVVPEKISVFIAGKDPKPKEQLIKIIEQIKASSPVLKTDIFVVSNIEPDYDVKELNISKWLNINKDDFKEEIKKAGSKYSIITHDYISHPPYWIERLLNYFKWYPGSDAVNALSNNDDYRSLIDKYFPGLNPSGYENVAHHFRHFIGAAIDSHTLNGQCFAIKTDLLKEIDFSNDKPLLNNISEYLSVTGKNIRLAPDVFVHFNPDDVFQLSSAKIPDVKTDYADDDYVKTLVANIENNPWDVDSRMKLFEIQSGKKMGDNQVSKALADDTGSPKVSIILITFNQLEYTKECVQSIIDNTKVKYEIIFVDNKSTDSTLNWLKKICPDNPGFRFIANEENLGFPRAANQGIKESRGEYVLLLNNDTHVTSGWLERLIEAAGTKPDIGIVGPVSNSVSGVQLDTNARYQNIKEMYNYAGRIKGLNKGKTFEFPRVAFLCTLIKKEVIDKIGGLDERFSPGNYEDDDFCLRAQIAGYKTIIAEDVFIHHYGSKSFKADGEKKYIDRLLKNRDIFVNKWGADPDEIWLKGYSYKKRNIMFPVNKDIFTENLERAVIYLDEKEPDRASEAIKIALENFNENNDRKIKYTDLLYIAGNNALALNDLETAQKYFEEELRILPGSSEACTGLGEVFFAYKNYDSSKTMYEWAVKNDLLNVNAVKGLAKANRQLGLPDDNNSLNEQQIIPENKKMPLDNNEVSEFSAAFLAAYDLYESKQYKDALLKLYEAESSYDENEQPGELNLGDLNVLKGVIYLSLDELNPAKKSFEKALNINPESAGACVGLGEVFYRLDMKNEAKLMFEWAIKYQPENGTTIQNLARINKELGLPEDDNSVEAELSEKSEVFVLVREASELFIQKQYAASLSKLLLAEDYLDEVTSLKKRNELSVRIDNFKGFIYLEMGKIEKAKTCFEKALGVDPQSSQACTGLGEILFISGKKKEAKTLYEHGVKSNPDNQIAAAGLKKVNLALGLDESDNSLL